MTARIAAQLLMQAEWCERHHPGCDCARIYRANAAKILGGLSHD